MVVTCDAPALLAVNPSHERIPEVAPAVEAAVTMTNSTRDTVHGKPDTPAVPEVAEDIDDLLCSELAQQACDAHIPSKRTLRCISRTVDRNSPKLLRIALAAALKRSS